MNDNVQLNLTKYEALVLFEWLACLDEPHRKVSFDDAQQHVIWKLEGQLEKMLPELFAPDYHDRLAKAKQRIVERKD